MGKRLTIAYRKYRRDGIRETLLTIIEYFIKKSNFFNRTILLSLIARPFILSQEELAKRGKSTDQFYPVRDECSIELTSDRQDIINGFSHRLGDYPVNSAFGCILEDVYLLGPKALAVTHDGQLIMETAHRSHLGTFSYEFKYHLADKGLVSTLHEFINYDENHEKVIDTAILMDCWWPGYYKWVIECLPQFQLVDETNLDPSVIIRSNPPSWMIESLQLLGVDQSQIIEYDKPSKVRSAIIPSFQFRDYHTPRIAPNDIQWLRKSLMNNSTSNDYSKRIYVSRQDADNRRVRNREELLDVISNYGFEAYILEKMSVEQQIKLFGQAETVVAPHGAGLTNIVFSNNISVIELFPYEITSDVYFCISQLLDHDYNYLQCERLDQDMIVDTEELKTIFEETIA